MVNAGFEYDSGWHFPVTAYSAGYSTESWHSGARSARSGIRSIGDNRFSYSSVQQTVTIPSAPVSVTLSLWWNAFSTEAGSPSETAVSNQIAQAVAAGTQPDESLAGDRQYILLLDAQGVVLKQLLWTRRNLQQWQPLTFDLSDYAGETVRLHFGVYNDGVGGVTSIFIDDVTLSTCAIPTADKGNAYLPMICKQSAPAPTPTFVPTAVPLWADPPTAIEVFSPLPNETYRTPLDVNGFSRTFGGNVYLRLFDQDGNPIGQHRTHGGVNAFDFFHGYLRFEVTDEMSATLQVYEAPASDQPPISQARIPINLQPGQRFVDLNVPAVGNRVCGRVLAAGYSNTFEANVVVELTRRDGAQLERTNTLGGAWGIYDEFATSFDYAVTVPQAALVGAMEISPRDGELVDHTRAPVTLLPAGTTGCQQ